MEPRPPTKGNRQFFRITLGLMISVFTFYVIKQSFFKTSPIKRELVDAVNQVNKTCPIMVDEATRLDSTLALPGNIFQSNYTLLNIEKTELNVDTLKTLLEPKLIYNARTNPDLKLFRDNMITMAFNYNDKKGVFILKLLVTPDKYAIK